MADEKVSINRSALGTIALEAWRLHKKYSTAGGADRQIALKFGLNKIMRELESAGVEFIEFKDIPYDGGLVVEVFHTVQDESNREGQLVISETVEPMLLWKGQVLHRGKVILTRDPKKRE